MITIPATKLRDGSDMPTFGLGTWQMGESPGTSGTEIRALRAGIDVGITLIDTAEMYGNGGAERVVAGAVRGNRERIYLVSKVLPSNAARQQTLRACEQSLQRLGTDYLDLYLLHWRGPTPLEETVGAFEALKAAGKIRRWGVSNFDVKDMEELESISTDCVANQVLYNLSRRGIEYDLLEYCRTRSIALMAYSPIEQGRLLRDRVLKELAQAREVTAAQFALAWVLDHPGVVAIPKTGRPERVAENAGALDIILTDDERRRLNVAFPGPERKHPLEML